MSEEMIVRYCSPTLAALKSGSLFSCRYTELLVLYRSIERIKKELAVKGICITVLSLRASRALIYVYRPSQLGVDLSQRDARLLLREKMYVSDSIDGLVSELRVRLNVCSPFPHEIGLFLGYPCEDVRGFIENRASGYRTVGAWKVYGDAQEAEKRFYKYKKCTEIYLSWLKMGGEFAKLAVAE